MFQYKGQCRIVLSIFKVSGPIIQRDCPSTVQAAVDDGLHQLGALEQPRAVLLLCITVRHDRQVLRERPLGG